MSTPSDDNVRQGSGQMFDAIAHRYDLLNRVLSMGLDQGWRRKAIAALGLRQGDRIMDLATGTADLAIAIANQRGDVEVEGVDPSANMIAEGREKVSQAQLAERVSLELGDGQALEFDDNSFDGCIIGFGIRNFPDRQKGLAEMLRVVKPGRKVVILELAEPREGLLAPFARLYVHHIVPAIGGVLSGSGEYRYLQKSIAAFPSREEFAALMREVGYADVRAEALNFGVVSLYVGTVPETV